MTRGQAERKAEALTQAGTSTYVSEEKGRPGGYRTRSAAAHHEANGRYDRSVRGQLLNYRAHIRRRIGAKRARLAELIAMADAAA